MALLLDETAWDLARPIRKATAAETIRQTIAIRLRTIRGEWAFDIEQGLPFYGTILGVNPDLRLIEGIVRLEVELVAGVTRVLSTTAVYARTTRELTITVNVLTDEGALTVTV